MYNLKPRHSASYFAHTAPSHRGPTTYLSLHDEASPTEREYGVNIFENHASGIAPAPLDSKDEPNLSDFISSTAVVDSDLEGAKMGAFPPDPNPDLDDAVPRQGFVCEKHNVKTARGSTIAVCGGAISAIREADSSVAGCWADG